MAYGFNGSGDYVQFAVAPFSGHTFGALTMAVFFRRLDAFSRVILAITTSSGGHRLYLDISGNDPRLISADGANAGTVSQAIAGSTWWLLAVTYPGSGGTPRFHRHNGTSWAHANASSGDAADTTIASGDLIRVATRNPGAGTLTCDVACCGIKKANASDGTIETLSRTDFQDWRDFGFEWLIGFDSSLESAGLLQDQGTAGTGDESAISGTSVVSDPPSWAWVTATPPPVADFSATPLTGVAPLSVDFVDESTNTPTSWAWDFGDGDTDTVQDPTHSYAAAGTYDVELVATNAGGSDTETKSDYVTVDEEGGGPPTARFQVAFSDITLEPSPTWVDME